ncbi:MAG: RDD family protein [Moraxella sp.]|nr:RDD family protein [Moraxella sp.]
MKIYLARNNVQAGPYGLDELNTMLSSGEVVLDDLMWHKGMDNWQSVGQMTQGQLFYQPNTPQTPTPTDPNHKRGFGDNVDFYPPKADLPNRVSVAELYGRKTTQDTLNLSKPQSAALQYASVSSRFVAFLINSGLFFLALLPLFVAFVQHIDINELAKATDYASAYTYSQNLAKKIPTNTTTISNIMLSALIGMQLLLIIMRGQSFGKMVMGIRVVDEKTQKIPKLTTLLFVRTCFLVVVYFIAMTIMSGLPAIILLTLNYLVAKKSPTSQGWHDRLSKTIVVKAQPIQLDKTKTTHE